MNDGDEDYVFTEEEEEQEVNLFEPFPQQVLLHYFLRKFHIVRCYSENTMFLSKEYRSLCFPFDN